MINIGEVIYQQCFAVQPGERVLIVFDRQKRLEAELLRKAAQQIGLNIRTVEVIGITENAQEPPPDIQQELLRCDVALLVTHFSLSHTMARKRACEAGVRIASLPGITKDMLSRTMTADYKSIATISQQLAILLTEGQWVTITAPGGTNLTLSIKGRAGIADDGELSKPGAFGNLPAGEAFLAPVETSVNGRLVIDASLADIVLDEPVVVEIKNGRIVALNGGQAAQDFRAALDLAGPNAFVVAELGIGAHPLADPRGDVLEAEKALGTCHIAFGNNLGFGGLNDAPFHSDGVVLQPTLVIDDRTILNQGKITIEKGGKYV